MRDIVYKDITLERARLDLYLPQQDAFDLLVYFHGGGLVNGDKAKPMESLDALVRAGIAVV